MVFHAQGDWAELGYAGLTIFIALSAMIDVHLNWRRQRGLLALARSLLVPWAFWMVFYAAFSLAKGGRILPPVEPVLAVLSGTSGHLWFLPFIFGVLLLLQVVKRHANPAALYLVACALTLAVFATAAWWRPMAPGWPVPMPQWAQAAGAVTAGVALGLAPRAGRLTWPGIAILIAAMACLALIPVKGISLPFLVALPVTAIAVLAGSRAWPASWNVQPAADCMLGVYLVHIFMLSLAGAVVPRGGLLLPAVAYAASFIAVYLARRMVPASRIVLG